MRFDEDLMRGKSRKVLISAYTLNALENARREIAVGNVPKFSHHLSTVAELLKIDEIPIALLK